MTESDDEVLENVIDVICVSNVLGVTKVCSIWKVFP